MSPRPFLSSDTLDRVIPYIVSGLVLIVGLVIIAPYAVGVFHDDGAYAILARSVAEGNGFRFLHLPGEPAAIHYPPGYPLVLAALWKVAPRFPANVAVLLSANAVFLAVAAWGTYRYSVRVLEWRPWAGAVIALVSTLSLPMLLLASILVSESMFVAMLLPMLLVAESIVDRHRPKWQIAVFGIGCGLLALIRTHGLSLPLAVVLLLLWRRRLIDAALVGVGAVITIAPWQVWQASHGPDLPAALQGSYGSYSAWFAAGLGHDGFLTRTVSTNAREIASLLGARFAIVESPVVMTVAAVAAPILLLIGAWRMFRRGPVIVAFAAIYLAIVMIWPYAPWRFVFGLWPVIIILLGESVRHSLAGARKRRPIDLAISGVAVVVAAGVLVRETATYRERAWSAPARVATPQTLPSMFWILRNTRESAVIASEASELVYLYTGRKSVPVMPFNAEEYGVPRSLELDGAGVRAVVGTLPVNFVTSISRDLRMAASQVDFGASRPALILVDTLSGGGGVFRVDR
jgi:hypothetical protein